MRPPDTEGFPTSVQPSDLTEGVLHFPLNGEVRIEDWSGKALGSAGVVEFREVEGRKCSSGP